MADYVKTRFAGNMCYPFIHESCLWEIMRKFDYFVYSADIGKENKENKMKNFKASKIFNKCSSDITNIKHVQFDELLSKSFKIHSNWYFSCPHMVSKCPHVLSRTASEPMV